ncbi:hypothetical protein CTA1_4051 [Colletotrichum tanaceti]|uniref:Uncharacterized protein n=1 Tax=Colletotrichum tanaceti TaxID=1306861 RepID=A0A4U6XEV9_9PEZI|nr:hypothetical protein CTA1_4051 [Colletotrichum tanaceti]
MPTLLTSSPEGRACVPPSNRGAPIDVCEFCCACAVVTNSASCHPHGESCPGRTAYHCDSEHLELETRPSQLPAPPSRLWSLFGLPCKPRHHGSEDYGLRRKHSKAK